MSAYTPPDKNLAIFDPSVFTSSGNDTLTQAEADTRYLRFPTAQGTETLQDVNVLGTTNASGRIISNSPTFSSRQIFTSYYNFYDGASGQTSLVQTGRIFCLNATCYFDMITLNNSVINFRCRVNDTNYTPLILTDQIVAQRNLVFNTASSIIDQTNILADTGNYNILKRTEVRVNNGGSANNLPALDIYDSNSSNGRGIRFVADANSGAYNNLTTSRDAVIVNRYRVGANPVGLIIGLQDAGGTGVRFSSATSAKGRVQIQAGTTNVINIYDDSDATYPDTTTYSKMIRMIGTDTNSRNIVDVGVISMKDLGGTSSSAGIYVSGGGNQVIYVANNSGYKHSFYTYDGSNFNARFVVANTGISQSVATDTTSVSTYSTNQNGYVYNVYAGSIAGTNNAVASIGSLTFVDKGIYSIHLGLTLLNASGSTNFIASSITFGLSSLNNAFLSYDIPISTSIYRATQGLSLPPNADNKYSTSCIHTTLTSNSTIYLLTNLGYTTPANNCLLAYNITAVKIS